jgi:hypothetical protein
LEAEAEKIPIPVDKKVSDVIILLTQQYIFEIAIY